MHKTLHFCTKNEKIYWERGTTLSSDPFSGEKKTPLPTFYPQVPFYIQILATPSFTIEVQLQTKHRLHFPDSKRPTDTMKVVEDTKINDNFLQNTLQTTQIFYDSSSVRTVHFTTKQNNFHIPCLVSLFPVHRMKMRSLYSTPHFLLWRRP